LFIKKNTSPEFEAKKVSKIGHHWIKTKPLIAFMILLLGFIVCYLSWTFYIKFYYAGSSLPTQFKIEYCHAVNGNGRRTVAHGKTYPSGQKGTVKLVEYERHLAQHTAKKSQKSSLTMCQSKDTIPVWLYANGMITGRIPTNETGGDIRSPKYYSSMVRSLILGIFFIMLSLVIFFYKKTP